MVAMVDRGRTPTRQNPAVEKPSIFGGNDRREIGSRVLEPFLAELGDRSGLSRRRAILNLRDQTGQLAFGVATSAAESLRHVELLAVEFVLASEHA
jgi:hypothetical protein